MNDLRSELRMAHPRPDFTREHWHSLEGTWAFAFDDEDVGLREGWQHREDGFPMEIRVPFAYQSELSGIGTADYHPVMWYQRHFEAPAHSEGQRVLLHFGAVDYACRVFVNGQMVARHRGGYLPFSADITPALRPGRNSLSLRVVDTRDTAQPRGKQYWDDGLFICWYTPCSGIWQSVYMEIVGDTALRAIYVTPDIDRCLATVEVNVDRAPKGDLSLCYDLYFEGQLMRSLTSTLPRKRYELALDMRDGSRLDSVRLWSPDTPHLYDLVVTLRRGEQVLDRVATYFGMRKVSTHSGHVLLNNMPLYQRLVLDQGYWPQSLMTPPDNQALKRDVELIQALGFNGVRMHQKIEDPRFYYWCDRLGLLCWGELPSAYEFCRDEVVNLTETMTAFIQRDFNHPSIITWVPLNESWGAREIYENSQQQRLSNTLFQLCKAMDPTRLVIGNDGWEQIYTDIVALHDYAATGEQIAAHFADREQMEKGFADWRMTYAKDFEPEDGPYQEPFMITEYGGIAMTIKGRQGQVGNVEAWGYNDMADSEEAFLARFRSVTDAIRAIPYCRGYCYTQLTDILQEINGLLLPDRTPKIDPALFARYNVNPEGYGRPGAR
ncbi:MAG: glycoside hydrolase family 2 [Clostridiales bacterium]|nr:glycoside hydrolase family 2 [Clostridiales bacterium]